MGQLRCGRPSTASEVRRSHERPVPGTGTTHPISWLGLPPSKRGRFRAPRTVALRASYWMVISSPFDNDTSRLRGRPGTVLPAGMAEPTEGSM